MIIFYVNNISDQINATITILLIFESAQHVRCEGCCSSNIPHTENTVYAASLRTSNLLQH